ncbi:MAG: TerB N-terminal domain-containing protein [Collinsella sp.]|nr:TerB N-terminal domain-containing protein [Collinsella sp.]
MDRPRGRVDVHEIIDRVMRDERLRGSAAFSSKVHRDEPILITGRQMASFLPEEYRAMRRISRWEQGDGGAPGRWLTEAELFCRQGASMGDFRDDCPYRGRFPSPRPTYSAMSDRQLRGYFTWRARLWDGLAPEGPGAFGLVRLYEILCGIGVADPLSGFGEMRAIGELGLEDVEVERPLRSWLLDYVVYHGLDPHLLDDHEAIAHDRKVIALRDAKDALEGAMDARGTRRRGGATPPADPDLEEALLRAMDALSTRDVARTELFGDVPADVCHVASAVFFGLIDHCRRNRKTGFLDSWLGEEVETPHTMFSTAVFHEPSPHADAIVELNAVHRYRCSKGLWTCSRIRGPQGPSPELDDLLGAVCAALARARGDEAIEGPCVPKYLKALIDREVAGRMAWNEAHAPITIDLSHLAGIRRAAAATCESLLTAEEREDAREGLGSPGEQDVATARSREPEGTGDDGARTAPDGPGTRVAGALDEGSSALLAALLAGEPPSAGEASLDVRVDALNEALFDLVGDTVVEFGPEGPRIIEDYREDVKGLI